MCPDTWFNLKLDKVGNRTEGPPLEQKETRPNWWLRRARQMHALHPLSWSFRWPSLVFLVPLHRLYAVRNRTECNIKLKRLQTYSVAEPHGEKEIQVKSSDGMKGNNEIFEIGSTGIAFPPPRVPDLNLSSSMQAQNHITRLAQHTMRHNYLFV